MSRTRAKRNAKADAYVPEKKPATASPWFFRRKPWSGGAALLAITVIVYLPAMGGGYIWDDDSYITENPTLLSAEGLSKIWFEIGATPQYYPLVFTSFWIEFRLWELHALGYHVVNVLLHAFSAVALWLVLRRLSVPGAWLAAAIFAVHPVQVESVAWITERKNMLSGLFYLTALLAYIRFDPVDQQGNRADRLWGFYGLSCLLFLCALLSKTVTCSLPGAILLLLWWKRERLTLRTIAPLIPMLVVGLVFGLTTAYLEKEHVGAKGAEWDLSVLERCLLAARIAWFYVEKLLLPVNLTFIYPRWEVDAAVWWQYLFPVAVIATVGLLWRLRHRLGRGPLVAVLIFGGTLTPALGFVDVYPMRFSYVADHFQYHASMAAIALFAVVLTTVASGRMQSAEAPATLVFPAAAVTRVLRSVGGVILLTLAILTWRQCRMYESRETLWRTTLVKNPAAWIAHNNLGDTMIVQGRLAEAAPLLTEALRLNAEFPEAHANLCFVQGELGQIEDAERHCREALRLRPDWPLALTNLCRVFAKQGRYQEAVAHCQRSIALKPTVSQAHTDLALALTGLGRMEEATAHFMESVRLDPRSAAARHNLAIGLLQTGRGSEAIAQWDEALRLKPDFVEASRSRAHALTYLQGNP